MAGKMPRGPEFMGRQDIKFTSKLFSTNSPTLEGWLTKKEMISKWITIVRHLDGRSVRKCIPKKFIHKYKESDNRYDSVHINLRPFEKKCINTNTQTKFRIIRSGFSSKLDIVKAKKEENLVIRRRAKRVRTDQKQSRLYQDIRTSIENEGKDSVE